MICSNVNMLKTNYWNLLICFIDHYINLNQFPSNNCRTCSSFLPSCLISTGDLLLPSFLTPPKNLSMSCCCGSWLFLGYSTIAYCGMSCGWIWLWLLLLTTLTSVSSYSYSSKRYYSIWSTSALFDWSSFFSISSYSATSFSNRFERLIQCESILYSYRFSCLTS